jgi:hypothetical protein
MVENSCAEKRAMRYQPDKLKAAAGGPPRIADGMMLGDDHFADGRNARSGQSITAEQAQ